MRFSRDYVNHLPIEVGLIILTLRGFLLWLIIPAGVVAWLTYFWWARSASLGQCLGWFDYNLIALLQRGLRRFIPHPTAHWMPSRKMSTVSHRFETGALL
jgi:hypothetical protein